MQASLEAGMSCVSLSNRYQSIRITFTIEETTFVHSATSFGTRQSFQSRGMEGQEVFILPGWELYDNGRFCVFAATDFLFAERDNPKANS